MAEEKQDILIRLQRVIDRDQTFLPVNAWGDPWHTTLVDAKAEIERLRADHARIQSAFTLAWDPPAFGGMCITPKHGDKS